MKKALSFLVVLLCAFALCAQSVVESSSQTEELKIVSLAPNVTEMVYALGSGSQLVGRTDYCNWPQEALSVRSIGTLWDPDMETVLALNADVAIASSIVDPSFIESLNKAGVKAYQFYEEDSFDGTYTLIEEVAAVIGKEKEAQAIIERMKARVAAVQEKTSKVEKKKSMVYMVGYGEWGDYAATGDTYLDGVIKAAGGINAAEEGTAWSISKELLIKADPDVILISGYEGMDEKATIADFISTAPYNQLTASKTGNVFVVDSDSTQRQGVRTADTVEQFAKILYPELF